MREGSAHPAEFWRRLRDAQAMARNGERDAAAGRLRTALAELPEGMDRNLVALIGRGLDLDTGMPDLVATESVKLAVGGDLPPLGTAGRPGISLVTCAMNRNENLLRALRSWRLCPEITEILIVDWSSSDPVRPALREAGLLEERIRVVRVEGESRWLLSHAFNAGFRAAACTRILKADADIVLEPDFFRRNRLEPGRFIAGNWRRSGDGQTYVNGFFYAHRADLAAVGGFNEYIVSYGWDDDELYYRLEEHGTIRKDVDPASIHHLPHSDEERLGAPVRAGRSLREDLTAGTDWHIRRNRFIANVMPDWDGRARHTPFEVRALEPRRVQIRRRNWTPNPVPDHVSADADYYALLEVAAWKLGRRVFALDRARLDALLDRTARSVGKLEIEVALAMTPEAFRATGAFLVISVERDFEPREGAPAQAFARLAELARAQGRTPVVTGPYKEYPKEFCEAARACPLIPAWHDIGEVPRVAAATLASSEVPRKGNIGLVFDAGAVGTWEQAFPAPSVAPTRDRLYIDAQHGLGNRLRAVGSAAAAAAASRRELVIVWEPDHHCEARFSELFDYEGPVIEESFPDTAAADGARLYNYMEVEPGAEKDAPVKTALPGDIYARSAYVLTAPGASWTATNRFLQDLRPVEMVRDLVASVRSPNDLSVHIRMVGAPGTDTASYDRAENWPAEAHAQINHWREKSHFVHFMRRIDALAAEGACDTIFLASDAPEAYEELLAQYGDRVAHLPRELYDRSADQLRYALADAILLGRAPRLLGSTWSSFSELATRLARQEMTVELSGTDF